MKDAGKEPNIRKLNKYLQVQANDMAKDIIHGKEKQKNMAKELVGLRDTLTETLGQFKDMKEDFKTTNRMMEMTNKALSQMQGDNLRSRNMKALMDEQLRKEKNERMKTEGEIKKLGDQIQDNNVRMLTRLIDLEAFKHTCGLNVEHLNQERRSIKRQVDTEIHLLTDVKKKMELTIDDFITKTKQLKEKHDEDTDRLEAEISKLRDPVENKLKDAKAANDGILLELHRHQDSNRALMTDFIKNTEELLATHEANQKEDTNSTIPNILPTTPLTAIELATRKPAVSGLKRQNTRNTISLPALMKSP